MLASIKMEAEGQPLLNLGYFFDISGLDFLRFDDEPPFIFLTPAILACATDVDVHRPLSQNNNQPIIAEGQDFSHGAYTLRNDDGDWVVGASANIQQDAMPVSSLATGIVIGYVPPGTNPNQVRYDVQNGLTRPLLGCMRQATVTVPVIDIFQDGAQSPNRLTAFDVTEYLDFYGAGLKAWEALGIISTSPPPPCSPIPIRQRGVAPPDLTEGPRRNDLLTLNNVHPRNNPIAFGTRNRPGTAQRSRVQRYRAGTVKGCRRCESNPTPGTEYLSGCHIADSPGGCESE